MLTISIAVPQGHRLAKRESLAPEDLDGETFVMFENVGFWADHVRRALPRSKFVIQEEHAVFEQLSASGNALSFVSDSPSQGRDLTGYVHLPFDDPSSTASFYLLARADATGPARKIFEEA